MAEESPTDLLLCKQKEKRIQTFDEVHVSQVLSLIDERERWWEGKAKSRNEGGRKMHRRHFVWSYNMALSVLQVDLMF